MRSPIIGGNKRRWIMSRREVGFEDGFIAQTVTLWDQGLDTKAIAQIVFQPEYIVESAVRIGRERRRRAQQEW